MTIYKEACLVPCLCVEEATVYWFATCLQLHSFTPLHLRLCMFARNDVGNSSCMHKIGVSFHASLNLLYATKVHPYGNEIHPNKFPTLLTLFPCFVDRAVGVRLVSSSTKCAVNGAFTLGKIIFYFLFFSILAQINQIYF